jgi:hypothetical protein
MRVLSDDRAELKTKHMNLDQKHNTPPEAFIALSKNGRSVVVDNHEARLLHLYQQTNKMTRANPSPIGTQICFSKLTMNM